MAKRTAWWLGAIAGSWRRRLGLAFVPLLVLGLTVPESGCSGSDWECKDDHACYASGEEQCKAKWGCMWVPSCRTLPCSGHASQASCDANLGCRWHAEYAACTFDDRQPACEGMKDALFCASHAYCSWTPGCVDNPETKCSDANSSLACESMGRCRWDKQIYFSVQ